MTSLAPSERAFADFLAKSVQGGAGLDCPDKMIKDLCGPLSPEIFNSIEEAILATGAACEIGVTHDFYSGLYIRSGTIPCGLALGYNHKDDHHCVILSGSMILWTEHSGPKFIRGPAIFKGMPGRKFAFVFETIHGQNVHSTANWPERLFNNVPAMEDYLYDFSPQMKAARKAF